MLWIQIHWTWIRIPLFKWIRIRIRIQDFDDQKMEKQLKFCSFLFGSKLAMYSSLGLHKGRPSYRRSLQPSSDCESGSGYGSRDPGSGSTTLLRYVPYILTWTERSAKPFLFFYSSKLLPVDLCAGKSETTIKPLVFENFPSTSMQYHTSKTFWSNFVTNLTPCNLQSIMFHTLPVDFHLKLT